jgi:hypothetical protein
VALARVKALAGEDLGNVAGGGRELTSASASSAASASASSAASARQLSRADDGAAGVVEKVSVEMSRCEYTHGRGAERVLGFCDSIDALPPKRKGLHQGPIDRAPTRTYVQEISDRSPDAWGDAA